MLLASECTRKLIADLLPASDKLDGRVELQEALLLDLSADFGTCAAGTARLVDDDEPAAGWSLRRYAWNDRCLIACEAW